MVIFRKFVLFVLVLLLVNPFTFAQVNYDADESTGGLDVSRPDDNLLETQKIFTRISNEVYSLRNKPPINTLNAPADGRVVSGNLITFSWTYSDYENDEQLNYQLEIDDDPRFYSSFSYYGFGENIKKVYIADGDKPYYWRVKSRDTFGWGAFSQVETFYLDFSSKVCEDGTSYFECSLSNFKYCEAGELIDNCELCGCPLNSECSPSGICLEKLCFDGTRHGACSIKQPDFCQNRELKQVCSLCGCPEGRECDLDGTCSNVIIEIKNPTFRQMAASSFFGFWKSLFS